ncbi:MAG: LPS assembly protein LptD [Mariprofundaceae bacterium]|nr:LPS assembly protein LptD [Mariprofundaceae bacterium]
MRLFLLPCLLLAWTTLIPQSAVWAEDVDITADKIVRDAKGVATASGKVEIQRKDETINADTVRYDAANHRIEAEGNVVIRSPKAVVEARSAELNTLTKQGILHDATVTLPCGERLFAKQLERVDEFTYKALQPSFTICPADHDAWMIRASEAVLDQKNGTFTARNARFEIAGVPVFYTPYWQQSNRRKSGLLLPKVNTGKRRGTELALPIYLAPAPDWDITLTPHWMSARGLRYESELRHVSTMGSEIIQFEGLYDQVLGRTRGRLRGQTSWQLPYDMNLAIDADHVSESDYLADFSSSASEASIRFLHSRATLSQQGEYGNWRLWVQHQRDMTLPSNEATLQILPRFENELALPVMNRLAILHFDQETTRFGRSIGSQGWRMYLHPYMEIPLELAGGGISTTLTAGVRNTRYWLTRRGTALQRPTQTHGEFSVETRAIFERINADKTLRHSIEPILRYDLVNGSDQTSLPNFDSAFGRLTLSNLLSGNRFSGRDRVENVNRVSMLLASRLQTKSEKDDSARTVLNVRAGVTYNIRKRLSDRTLQTEPLRPFSNLVGEVYITPIPSLSFSAEGQYDPAARFWDTATTAINWNPASGHQLRVGYRVTDARFAPESQAIDVSGKLNLGSRWRTFGAWNYDTLLKFTQHASLGVEYRHPCWHVTVEAYRINRPSGTSTTSNFGVNFLLGINGMGSVGQCTSH